MTTTTRRAAAEHALHLLADDEHHELAIDEAYDRVRLSAQLFVRHNLDVGRPALFAIAEYWAAREDDTPEPDVTPEWFIRWSEDDGGWWQVRHPYVEYGFDYRDLNLAASFVAELNEEGVAA